MRWVIAVVLAGLAMGAAAAQEAPAEPPSKPSDNEVRPTTLRLPEYDTGDRVVVIGMVPIPDVGEGAPLFTSRDIAAIESEAGKTAMKARSDMRRCLGSATGIMFNPTSSAGNVSLLSLLDQEYEVGNWVERAAAQARQVTERAENVRSDAAAGKADMQAVEAAELERQAAVNALQKARARLVEAQAMIGDWQDMMLGQRGKVGITWSDLDMHALKRKKEGVGLGIALPQETAALDIQNVKASQHKDKKGKDIVVVTGDILNSGAASAKIPPLSVSIIDDRGWVLSSSTVSPVQKKKLGARKRQAFQVEVRPAPELLKTAIVAFAAKAAPEPRMSVGVFCAGFPPDLD